jgi:hypothetical protein
MDSTIIYISLGVILLSVLLVYYTFKKIINAHTNEILTLKKELLELQEKTYLGKFMGKNNLNPTPTPTPTPHVNTNTDLKNEYSVYKNTTNFELDNDNMENISEELKDKINNLTANEDSLTDKTESSELEDSLLENTNEDELEPTTVEEVTVEEVTVEEVTVEEVVVEEVVVEEVAEEVAEEVVEEVAEEEVVEEEVVEEDTEKYNLKSLNSDLTELSLKELQNIARSNNIKVKGKKNELIERINTEISK